MLTQLDSLIGRNKQENSFALLFSEIDDSVAKEIVEWILMANFAEGDDRPSILNLMINSPGGDLTAGFAIVDVMRGSSIPIRTIGLGQIASAGLMIFLAGEKGQRVLTPNTSIMSHTFSAGAIGKRHELISIQKEFDMTHDRILDHYVKFTGLDADVIEEKLLTKSDVYLSAKEAFDLGICDIVSELK
jgi:ATP-dependent Clp protease protease subunit